MVAQPCEYTKIIDLKALEGWILWYVNYVSIKLFFNSLRELYI